MKICKTAISDIFPVFLVRKKLLSKIRFGHVLSIPNMHLCAKIQKKLLMKSQENAKKQTHERTNRRTDNG